MSRATYRSWGFLCLSVPQVRGHHSNVSSPLYEYIVYCILNKCLSLSLGTSSSWAPFQRVVSIIWVYSVFHSQQVSFSLSRCFLSLSVSQVRGHHSNGSFPLYEYIVYFILNKCFSLSPKCLSLSLGFSSSWAPFQRVVFMFMFFNIWVYFMFFNIWVYFMFFNIWVYSVFHSQYTYMYCPSINTHTAFGCQLQVYTAFHSKYTAVYSQYTYMYRPNIHTYTAFCCLLLVYTAFHLKYTAVYSQYTYMYCPNIHTYTAFCGLLLVYTAFYSKYAEFDLQYTHTHSLCCPFCQKNCVVLFYTSKETYKCLKRPANHQVWIWFATLTHKLIVLSILKVHCISFEILCSLWRVHLKTLRFVVHYTYTLHCIRNTLHWISNIQTNKHTYTNCILSVIAHFVSFSRTTRAFMHCNTLQHTATHCNTLQHTAAHWRTLQHTATHRNTLQHTTTPCNTLHHTVTQCILFFIVASAYAHCNALQHTATHCNAL